MYFHLQPLPQLIRFFLVCSITLAYLHLLEISKLYAHSYNSRARIVTRQEIQEAMRMPHGYDPTVTTNVARFKAEVLLRLAREAQEREPEGPPILIDHTDWFYAFLKVNNLSIEEAPTFAILSYQYGQDQLIDYCTNHVIKKVEKGPSSIFAINVLVCWPETPKGPSNYSFQDTLSTPHLKITNNRVITYRLLDFGDMIVYDDIHGLTGRPTSGLLGFLFRLIGEGRVVQSRITVSQDGIQITRARVRKGPIEVNATVTVRPDGYTEKGVPRNRPDLLDLEMRLKKPFKIKYMPFNYSKIQCQLNYK